MFLTILLRDIFGIPVWATGFLLAIRENEDLLYEGYFLSLVAGWTLVSAGAVLIIASLISIRLKAAVPSAGDKLVSSGTYSVVRHPIHCGTFLEFVGLFLIWPSLNLAISAVIGIIWIVLQSRLEERDLLKRIPEYKAYKNQVPAFIPLYRSVDTSGENGGN
jgi:protein-S-isoprenylcysteine O-methyltransferase Ste14